MNRKLFLLACLLPLFLAANAAHAQTARQARAEVEMSMLVRGHVDIDREGLVTAHALEQPGKLPDYIINFLDTAVPAMRFEPVTVDGEPVLSRAKMTLRVVAEPEGDGDTMHLGIRSAHFGDDAAIPDEERVRQVKIDPPRYPADTLRAGGKGTVYLLLKVGRDGSVEDVVVEQTNLTAVGTARQMQSTRDSFEAASIAAAKKWRFAPPVAGEEADEPYWALRIPVEYEIGRGRPEVYGQWLAYHPGERAPRPEWAGGDAPGFSPDLLTAGTAHQANSRFRLLQAP